MIQLALELFPEQRQDEAPQRNRDPFEPNAHRRCPGCRRRLGTFGGKLYCLHVGCTEAIR